MQGKFRWTRNQTGLSASGFGATEHEAFAAALNAAPNALNASIKVFNASSGIRVRSQVFRLGIAHNAVVKGWFPSDQ